MIEPVAWMHVSRHGTNFGKADGAVRPETISLYSSDQIATLQAENELLKTERNELAKAILEVLDGGDTLRLAVRFYLLSHNANVTGLAPAQETTK